MKRITTWIIMFQIMFQIIAILFSLTLAAAIIYIAWHFISKFW